MTILYSFVVTVVILVILKRTIGIRVSDEDETMGLDASEHGETAYHSSNVMGGL